jgi:hypothetical protein
MRMILLAAFVSFLPMIFLIQRLSDGELAPPGRSRVVMPAETTT